MNIRASVKFDERLAKTLSKVMPRSAKAIRLIMSIFYLVFFIYSVILLAVYGFSMRYALLLFVLTLAFIVLGTISQLTMTSRVLKRFENARGTVNEYVFTDDVMKESCAGEGISDTAEISYSKLVKLVETNEFFLVFPSKYRYFPVDKATIEGGTEEELRTKLRTVPGIKYEVRRI